TCPDAEHPKRCRNECSQTNSACRRDCSMARNECRADCRSAFQDDVTEPEDCFPCRTDPASCANCPPLDDAITGEQACLDCLAGDCSESGQSFFNMCTGQCASPKPGVCAQNLTCVGMCRIAAGGQQQNCHTRFRQQVRAICNLVACGPDPNANYFVTARRTRRRCVRDCTATTTTTTPSTTTTTIARASVTASVGGPAASDSTTTTTTSTTSTTTATLPPTRGCNCQQHCVRTIVGGCYNDCKRACRGDRDALN